MRVWNLTNIWSKRSIYGMKSNFFFWKFHKIFYRHCICFLLSCLNSFLTKLGLAKYEIFFYSFRLVTSHFAHCKANLSFCKVKKMWSEIIQRKKNWKFDLNYKFLRSNYIIIRTLFPFCSNVRYCSTTSTIPRV